MSAQVIDISTRRAQRDCAGVQRVNPGRMQLIRECAISKSLREYGSAHGLNGSEIAATIACALRVFRSGKSAASAIEAGRKCAHERAWGVDPKGPRGAA